MRKGGSAGQRCASETGEGSMGRIAISKLSRLDTGHGAIRKPWRRSRRFGM